MTVGKGLKVELFASEKEFPELVNPVQMAVRHAGTALGGGVEELSALGAEDADGRQAADPRGHERGRQGGQAHGLCRRSQQPHRLRVLQRRRDPRAGAEPGVSQGHQRRRSLRHEGDPAPRLRHGRHPPRDQQLHVRSGRGALHGGGDLPSQPGRVTVGADDAGWSTAASSASSRGPGSSRSTSRTTSPIRTATCSTRGAGTSCSTRRAGSRSTARRSRRRNTSRPRKPIARPGPAPFARVRSAGQRSCRAGTSPRRCRGT